MPKMTCTTTPTALTIYIPHSVDLEFAAQVLAEGGTILGTEAEQAGSALIQWAGKDCPWFNPGPTPIPVGLGITGLCY